MFGNEKHSQIIGNPEIDSSIKAIDKVVTFLDTYLPKFPSIFKNKTIKTKLTHEDDVSQMLSFHLNRQAHKSNLFFIHFQYRYIKTRRSSDFGILTIEDNEPNDLDKAFFVMEAKWLPLPKIDKNREKEYVIGNPEGGGIERFKRGNHGAGLSKSAMVAYVQSETCYHWQTKVNGWIQDLIDVPISEDIEWNNTDLLVFESQFDTTFKYHSQHKRIHEEKKDEIQLFHYWLPL